jgi:hypothetical protein
MRALAAVLAAAIGLALANPSLAKTDRGASIRVKDVAGTDVALYAESHALVIGISNYTNGWPKLRGVADDVPAVKAALETQGFQVTVVTDPDRDGLDKAFRGFIGRHGQAPDNRLLFYFAGHGHSMMLGYGGMMGYLVPTDAPDPNQDEGGFLASAFSMQSIEVHARNIQSKHAMFVFDSCFSGSIFDATRAIPDVIQAKTGKPVRQFITSGSAEQTVPDKSIFRRQFVAALEGEGDRDGDGYVTGAELGQFLETTVTNYTRQSQTPQYGKLRDPLLDKGDFVFVLPGGATKATDSPTSSQQGTLTAEMMFWQSIQKSDDPEMFEAYLSQFPNGTFAALARVKANKLKKTRMASLPPAREPIEIEDMDATFVILKSANIRAEPDVKSEKVGLLSPDTAVSVTGRVKDGNWYRIAYQSNAAYVFGTLVKEIDAEELTAWEEVKESREASDFNDFLRRYPNGFFADRARRSAKTMKSNQVAALITPNPTPTKPVRRVNLVPPSRRMKEVSSSIYEIPEMYGIKLPSKLTYTETQNIKSSVNGEISNSIVRNIVKIVSFDGVVAKIIRKNEPQKKTIYSKFNKGTNYFFTALNNLINIGYINFPSNMKLEARIKKFSGSLFPLHVGARLHLSYDSVNSSIKHVSSHEIALEITDRVPAEQVHHSFDGFAYIVRVRHEPTDKNDNSRIVTDSEHYLVENLGWAFLKSGQSRTENNNIVTTVTYRIDSVSK